MIRSRTITMIAALLGALALTVLSAVPVQAQAVTQSNLEGRLDKIRQGQRNARKPKPGRGHAAATKHALTVSLKT